MKSENENERAISLTEVCEKERISIPNFTVQRAILTSC